MRVATMLTCGLVTAVVVGISGLWGYAALIGWDVSAVVFLGWVWLAIAHMDARSTAGHATRENPDRATSDAILLIAAVASLVAVGFVLVTANSSKGTRAELLATLAVASVVLSWLAVHTLYTLRYAELYYAGTSGGIEFNQDDPPRYLDFAYLSFTIGMTFQVSDTNLQTGSIRATALRQSLLSYLFGSVILASMINLIAGLGTGHG
jgi:uncharacterized membrane protein